MVKHPEWDVAVVAHRGQVAGYPENTVAACQGSRISASSAIEVDLRATADGEIVIMHDDTVDRTTNGSGEVGEMTFAEIRSLDAGGHVHPRFAGQHVPTYQEVPVAAVDIHRPGPGPGPGTRDREVADHRAAARPRQAGLDHRRHPLP